MIDGELSKIEYFKYRSLNEFERFLDIILKKHLYGALYRELNDPMEGKFNHSGLNQDQINEIYPMLKRTRICSLMTKGKQEHPENYLMWSHYADGHKGCCLEVTMTKRNNAKWELVKMNYSESLPSVIVGGKEAVKTILSNKSELWRDEEEVRAIRIYDEKDWQSLSPYFAVNIKAIYLGMKVPYEKCKTIKRIVKAIDKNIAIYKMTGKELGVGLYPTLSANLL